MTNTVVSAGATALPNAYSRRSVLSGLAALATLTVASPTSAVVDADADAELLEIGRALLPLYAEESALVDQELALEPARNAIRDRRDGLEIMKNDIWYFGYGGFENGAWAPWSAEKLKPRDPPPEGEHFFVGMPKVAAYNARVAELTTAAEKWRQRLADFDESSGLNAIASKLDDIIEREGALEARARAIQATTIEGLAVKAMMLKLNVLKELWESDPKKLDYAGLLTRALVDNLAALAPALFEPVSNV